MNSSANIMVRVEQDKKNYYPEAIVKWQKKLKDNKESLESALRSNMNTLTNPALSSEEVEDRIKKIMAILAAPTSAMPEMIADNVDDLCRRLNELVDLYSQMQPSYISKIGILSSLRETIKSHLNTVGIRETIDPAINAYLHTQSRLLAEHIAYFRAVKQAEWVSQTQKSNPKASVEVLMLHRHEVCSTLNKGMGLKEDAGLDALTLGASQSNFNLNLAQHFKTTALHYFTLFQPMEKVEMKVSPVARAYQTGLYASFSPSVINEVTVDPHYAEVQYDTTFIASGRASRHCSDIAADFEKEGYRAGFTEDHFILGENGLSFMKRLNIAYSRMVGKKTNSTDMRIVMGHGTMNMHLLKHLRYHTASHNIPADPPTLDFGGYCFLLITRQEDRIVSVDYKGSFDRYGQQAQEKKPLTSIKALSDTAYLERLDKEYIPQAITPELKASLLFHRCLLDPSEEAVKTVFKNPDFVDVMLDHLSLLLDFHQLNPSFFILKTLTATQLQRLEERIKNESGYSFTSFFASVKNATTGKPPSPQFLILKELTKILGTMEKEKESGDSLSVLEELGNNSLTTCYEGKVTNLCRAVRDWAIWRKQNEKKPPCSNEKEEKEEEKEDDSHSYEESQALDTVYKG
ncbi:hypothetical protein DIZ81_06770 [Legionella taurinensis]|uniref:Uncharacterized protein n=1 Tax=Legionella taurinensis TaxID=70611 RepID=A0AB38N408_9GAMM|nr:hypothetical protein [Legionella taurinensis]MDX1837226.1 hypothetical protein [Legionella taurinensis]PUT40301.1 hypothetical protein DB744_06770 [Legionella taurinensis]PUT41535.1 hypothetical protein DB746_09280 [Legionella taurinensis]PUT44401.1 hypothetical protein DB743_08495 [Legionella taurinensis]PUT48363.1 hypothetical protein DB745_05170 [Legionella taurinensis]